MDIDQMNQIPEQQPKSWKKKGLIALFIILMIPPVASVLIHVAFIQNFLVHRIASVISEKTKCEVKLERVDLSVIDGLGINDLLIKDSAQDTMIATRRLRINLNKTLFSLLRGSLEINDIGLDGAHVYIRTYLGQESSNLEQFLLALSGSPKNENEKPSQLRIALKNIALSDVNFISENKNKGTFLKVSACDGDLKINKLDIADRRFDIQHIFLIEPIITMRTTKSKSDKEEFQEKENQISADNIAKGKANNKFAVLLRKLSIYDGSLVRSSNLGKLVEANFDSNNFEAKEIDVEIENISLEAGMLFAKVEHVSLWLDQRIRLKKLKTDALEYTQDTWGVSNFFVQTEGSQVLRNIKFLFRSPEDQKNWYSRSRMELDITGSEIDINELAYFIPNFQNSEFYKSNTGKKVFLNGVINGRPNNIRAENVSIEIPDRFKMLGGFGIRDIKGETPFIILRLKDLSTTLPNLRRLIPGFSPPKNFDKLNKIQFTGNFDGSLRDFTAYGKLKSDLGYATMDLRLQTRPGTKKAEYVGELNLNAFDLGRWADNRDLGKITFKSNIKNGEGFDLKSAKADLQAEILSLEFKKYEYKNIVLNGALNRKNFAGVLSSADPNVAFNFDGNIDLRSKPLVYDFEADLKKIDFYAIHLSKSPLTISSKIKFDGQGQNLNDIVGGIRVGNITIERNNKKYAFDSIKVDSKNFPNQQKEIGFSFGNTTFSMKGKIDFNSLVDDLKSIIKTNFPYHTKDWDFEPKEVSKNQDFTVQLQLEDAKSIFEIFEISDVNLEKFALNAEVNSRKQTMNLDIPDFTAAYKDNEVKNFSLSVGQNERTGRVHLEFDSLQVGKRYFDAVDLKVIFENDHVELAFQSMKTFKNSDIINLLAEIDPDPMGYAIKIKNSSFRVVDKRWKLNADNLLVIGKQYFELSNFQLTDGFRSIELDDINKRGLSLLVDKFDFSAINDVINYPKMYFEGLLNINVQVSSIFDKSPDILGIVNLDNLLINKDSYGRLNIDISKPLNEPLDAIFSLNNPEKNQSLKADIKYDLEKKDLSALVKGRGVPLKFLEYILVGGISNVGGYADLDARLLGDSTQLKLDGNGTLRNGKVRVNYLGETFSFDNQPVRITEKRIDLTGARLRDSQGNPAVILGGLNHDLFRAISLDANITAENAIIVNTTKYDNPTYYGIGKGAVSVDFSGPVSRARMVINATTKAGTKLNIPIKESKATTDKNFITFVDRNSFLTDSTYTVNRAFNPEGMEIEMNLTLSEESEVRLIFDETKNDILQGTGRGNMKISISRAGDFDIFGEYQVVQGQYLFTAGPIVNKPFVVRRGGTIKWSGDPVNASLNIEADYAVRTNLSVFLSEYLVAAPEDLRLAARNRVDVNLRLNLGGTLYNPIVKFDLEFPELIGQLRTFAENKVRILRNNELDFNSQVFGLIVFNSFLPNNALSDVVASNLGSAGINTISEFVSSQLSLFVTSLINEALEENGLLAGVDFDINLRNNDFLGSENQSLLPAEIEINFRNRFRFLDERLSFNFGGNFIRESYTGVNNYLIPEFNVQYALTKDRKVNLKFYGKYDLDEQSLNARRQKYGLGIRYRTEFGAMMETKTDISRNIEKIIKEQK